MASKKFIELQEYSEADLKNELDQTEAQYQKLKFDHAIKGLDDPLTLREVRRDIARLKTELRRRELSNMTTEDQQGRTRLRQRRRRQRKGRN